jgi:uncharacterized delta-60 repeat protein
MRVENKTTGEIMMKTIQTKRPMLCVLAGIFCVLMVLSGGCTPPAGGGAGAQPEKIIIGGNFMKVGTQTKYYLAQLNLDGTLDTSFNPNIYGSVFAIGIKNNNKIFVGGNIFDANGGVQGLAALSADGYIQRYFNLNGTVRAIAVQPDGKVVFGGVFSVVDGHPHNKIARLNADSTVDTSFTVATDSTVEAIALQADGKILLGGSFITVGGNPHTYIARLNADGTEDTSFTIGTDNTVYALAVQADGKILIAGDFTTVGGHPHTYIARLNADGTEDTSFTIGTDSTVYALAVQGDGKILLGGFFNTVGGHAHNRLARLNADGTEDTSFTIGTNWFVNVILVK